jgi:hypothetical protein
MQKLRPAQSALIWASPVSRHAAEASDRGADYGKGRKRAAERAAAPAAGLPTSGVAAHPATRARVGTRPILPVANPHTTTRTASCGTRIALSGMAPAARPAHATACRGLDAADLVSPYVGVKSAPDLRAGRRVLVRTRDHYEGRRGAASTKKRAERDFAGPLKPTIRHSEGLVSDGATVSARLRPGSVKSLTASTFNSGVSERRGLPLGDLLTKS